VVDSRFGDRRTVYFICSYACSRSKMRATQVHHAEPSIVINANVIFILLNE